MQITGLPFLFCDPIEEGSNLSLNFFSFVNDVLAEISGHNHNRYNCGMKIRKEQKSAAGLRKWSDVLSVWMRIFCMLGVDNARQRMTLILNALSSVEMCFYLLCK